MFSGKAVFVIFFIEKHLVSDIFRQSLIGWLVVFAAAGLLYFCTLAPDVAWQDQGDFQYHAAYRILNRPGDVVRVHPLYIVTAHYVGRLGIFNYAYAANLVSGIFAVITIANIFVFVFLLSGRVWAAVLAAGCYGLSHTGWFIGVQAQTYSMSNAAMTAGWILALCYLRSDRLRYLILMGFVFGLGVSAHMMSQVAFVVIMAWLLARCLKKQISLPAYLSIIAAWFAGAVLLWVVVWIEYKRSGDLGGALVSAIWGKWGEAVFNLGSIAVLLKKSVMFFVLNFPTPLVLLAAVGIYKSFRCLSDKAMAGVLLASTILYFLFAVRYDVPNQNHFFLPMYILVSIYIGLGFAFLFERKDKWPVLVTGILLACIAPTYFGMSELARAKEISLGTRRHVPFRDDYQYYLLPWQHTQIGPRLLATALFDRLPQGAVVIADSTVHRVLNYVHNVEGQRTDITLFKGAVNKDECLEIAEKGARVFVMSDVEGYYPGWVKQQGYEMKEFAISDTEHVYEVLIPITEHY